MRVVQGFLIVLVIIMGSISAKAKIKFGKSLDFIQEIDGIKEYRMKNGLKILLKPDQNSPSFCWQVWYKVGSRNESLNYTGIAHYLEHIMFKGTNAFEKGEIAQVIQLKGGIFNAFTGDDYTAYYENFSAENLELAIKIEADRMRNAKIDHDEVELERSVIVSELEGNRNSPFSILYENLRAQAFEVHTYRNPIIGWRDDLDNIDANAIRDFYETFYHPNNAVAVLVGNFDEELALNLIDKYFSDYQASEKSLPKVPSEPVQRGYKQMNIYNEGVTKLLGIAFHTPEFTHKDSPALSLVGDIVFSGLSSRLYPRLVDSGLASSVSGFNESSLDPGIFRIIVNVNAEADILNIENIIDEELENLKTNLSEAELDLVKAKERASFVYQKDGANEEALHLGYFEALSGDWTLYTKWLDLVDQVTVDDVKAVAKKYFVKANKTTVRLLPQKAPESLVAFEVEELPKKVEANYGAGTVEPISADKFKRLLNLSEKKYSKKTKFEDFHLQFEDLSRDNLRFYFKQNSNLPLIYANIALFAGNASEDKQGLAYITSQMLNRGSKNFDKFTISKLLDRYGADIDFSATREFAKIHFSTISENLDEMLRILEDILLNPSFDAAELTKLKDLMIAKLKQEDDSPAKVASREMNQIVYSKNHPFYVPSPQERIESLESITIEDVKEFYHKNYNSKNLFVSIVGDISKEKAQVLIDKLFLDLNRKFQDDKYNQKLQIALMKKQEAINKEVLKEDKTQSEIVIAHAGDLTRSDADFYPLYMANYALGGSPLSSRLGAVVRDENGLVYNVRSSFNATLGAGMFKIILGCNPKNVNQAIELTKKTTENFVKEGITDLELEMTKSYLTGSFPVRTLSSMESLSETLLQMLIYDLGYKYIDNYNESIYAVTKEAVNSAAKKYIKPEFLNTVVVGPRNLN